MTWQTGGFSSITHYLKSNPTAHPSLLGISVRHYCANGTSVRRCEVMIHLWMKNSSRVAGLESFHTKNWYLPRMICIDALEKGASAKFSYKVQLKVLGSSCGGYKCIHLYCIC